MIFVALGACGHKGPPLPPFSRVPSAPADVKVARRADSVELQFTVPSTNTDGTRPANIERVDVYGDLLDGIRPRQDLSGAAAAEQRRQHRREHERGRRRL